MSKRQELLAYFGKLSPDDIPKLSNAGKLQLLMMFHSEFNQAGYYHDKGYKVKTITKYRRCSYKSYVRRNMPNIIRQLAVKLSGESNPPEGFPANREGKLKFKQSIGQIRRRKMENFKQHFKEIVNESNKEELSCSICLEMLLQPVLTACGHVFCYQCLDQSMLFSTNCPNCRENIKGTEEIVCPLLDNFIRKAGKLCLPKSYSSYKERMRKFNEWRSKRELTLNSLRVGNLIDARDTENVWCQGTILEIFYENQRKECPNAVLIHFNRWNKIYNEIIDLPNLRLAPFRYFSNRTDIPRYHLTLPENNFRGLVISGPLPQFNLQPPQQLQQNFIEVDDSSSSSSDSSANLANAIGVVQQQQPRQLIFPSDDNPINQILNNWSFRIIRSENVYQQLQAEINEQIEDVEEEHPPAEERNNPRNSNEDDSDEYQQE